MLNSNIFPTSLQYGELEDNMVNFGLLAADIVSLVRGTRANFNGFRVLASLQRRRSPEANQTLHGVWPSRGLLHYIYNFGGSCPDGISPRTKFTLRPSLTFSYILAALMHGTPAAGVSQTLRRGTRNGIIELSQMSGRHLYSAGRPSRWASAHMGIGPHSTR